MDASNPEETALYRRTIRENMIWKDTDELIDIWSEHNSKEWTEEAFSVVGEILRERGIDLTHLDDEDVDVAEQTSDLPDWVNRAVKGQSGSSAAKCTPKEDLTDFLKTEKEDFAERSTDFLIRLYQKQNQALDQLYEELANRGIDADDYLENEKPIELLHCPHCDTELPVEARYCSHCGMNLYPEGSEAEEEGEA
jgi:predicted HTH domain antitoxin